MPVARFCLVGFVALLAGMGAAPAQASAAFLSAFHRVEVLNPPVSAAHLRLEVPGGAALPLVAYRGQWVVLNIWATWCAPCVAELPLLDALARQMSDRGVVIRAVSVDHKSDADRMAYHFTRWKIGFLPALHDSYGDVAGLGAVDVLPLTYIINPQGLAVARLYGPARWDSPAARAFVRDLARGRDALSDYGKKTQEKP